MVEPFARALYVLSAFTPQEPWLGNGDIAIDTGMPPPTVSRLLKTLVALGYLHYSPERRKYRLAAAVLALGFAAIAHFDLQCLAREQMQKFADQHNVHVTLATRCGLDLIIIENSKGSGASFSFDLRVGARVGIASSPMGWALLAALPELERFYLLSNVERRAPRDWSRLRRRCTAAMEQFYTIGFCTSLSEWNPDLGIVAVPLMIAGHAPLTLACIGSSSQMTKARVDRELGPRLKGIAASIEKGAMEVG